MDDRLLDLTEAQKAIKAKYPPITKKYECKSCILVTNLITFFNFYKQHKTTIRLNNCSVEFMCSEVMPVISVMVCKTDLLSFLLKIWTTQQMYSKSSQALSHMYLLLSI